MGSYRRFRLGEKGINKGKGILAFELAKNHLKTNAYIKIIALSTYMFGVYCTVYLYVFLGIAPSTYMFFSALHRLPICFFRHCTVYLYVS